MKAFVGVYLVRLEMPWVKSLKEKRSIIQPVVEKLKARFPLSVNRIDGANSHSWETIGFCLIGHNQAWVEQIGQDAIGFIQLQNLYTITEAAWHIEVYDLNSSTDMLFE